MVPLDEKEGEGAPPLPGPSRCVPGPGAAAPGDSRPSRLGRPSAREPAPGGKGPAPARAPRPPALTRARFRQVWAPTRSEPPRPRSALSNGGGGAARPGRERAIGLGGGGPLPLPPPFLPLPGANCAPVSVRVWPWRPRLDAARTRRTKERGVGGRGRSPGTPRRKLVGEGARRGMVARPRWGIAAAAEGTPGLEAGDGGTCCGLRNLGAAARAQGEWKRKRAISYG